MLTFGVIIDVSEPFKYEDKEEFVVKVKIIDPTFNFKAYITNKEIKFHKYVTVLIYSKEMAKCPKVKHVGEILRLRRFEFCLTPKGELTAFQNIFANWMIFKGDVKSGYSISSCYDIEKNKQRDLTPYEKGRIEELREWSYQFFSQHKLKFITWWSPLIEPIDEKDAIANRSVVDEIDIILKVERVEKDKKTIDFLDHGRKKYSLHLSFAASLNKGDVIKLRCVNM